MNKINNKGFMMAEIIVVAVVIVIALVGLFTTFTRTFIEYERLNEYSQVDSLYASKSVINTLYSDIDSAKKALEDESVNFKEYTVTTNIELEPLFNKYNIKSFYLVKYSDEGFNSLISSLTNNEELKRYVNYLKNNLNLTDGSCEVISILEMQSDSSSNKNQFGYYKFVKNSTSGGGEIYLDDALPSDGSTAPNLDTGLIPVVYNDSGSETKWFVADVTKEWYDYDTQMWANAVAVDSSNKINYFENGEYIAYKDDGELNEIAKDDLLAMFVWIPRFEYTIGCKDSKCLGYKTLHAKDLDVSTPGAIDINFVSKNKALENGAAKYDYTDESRTPVDWFTHPAFTYGSTPIGGFWVGKFETSVDEKNACYTTNSSNAYYTCTSLTYKDIRILPGVNPLTRQNIKTQNGLSFSTVGLTTSTHMMKNSEWVAVTYLSQSIYGKYGNDNYYDVYKEIYNNNYRANYMNYTGASSGNVKQESTTTLVYKYNDYDYKSGENSAGKGFPGPGASTTGTINGVYDMSGGNSEAVLGNYYKYTGGSTNSGFNSINDDFFNKGTCDYFGSSIPNSLGDGTYEVKSWYGFNEFVALNYSSPWIVRGGNHNAASRGYNGIFSWGSSSGSLGNAFRIISF